MLAANVIVADTDRKAERLFTSVQQQFLYIRRGKARQMQPPVDDLTAQWADYELAGIESVFKYALVGSPKTVQRQLRTFLEQTQADEFILSAPIFDHEARKHSLTLTAQVRDALATQPTRYMPVS